MTDVKRRYFAQARGAGMMTNPREFNMNNRAWHFVGDKLWDGSPVPADGEKLVFKGKPILGKQGLHWSKEPFDALRYATGATLCLVEYGGKVVLGDDKGCSAERTSIVRMDATPLLRYFARQRALSVVYLWEPPQVVLDFLMGDDSLREAAQAAAWGAAWGAAQDYALDAAQDAVLDAVQDSSLDNTRYATYAALAFARTEFNTLVHEAFADYLA